VNGSTANRASWGQLFAIAAAYAACYELARYFTNSHWALTAGLRLACLLLVPRRFWLALIIGETLPSIENAVLHGPQFGVAWAVAAAVPMVLLWIPVVGPLRRRWPLRAPNGSLRIGVLLTATLGCAIVTAVSSTLELEAALLSNPGAWPEISSYAYFWAYLLGAYLGALTLTPTILALHERASTGAPPNLARLWRSPLARDLVAWGMPMLGGLAWVAFATEHDTLRQMARLALLLPLFGLSLRHGWHGSAVGGMFASVALAMTGGEILDASIIRSQAVLALCISGTLLIGAWRHRRHAIAPPAARANR
jgi:two-component system, NarL family, sensor histidine kinase UhpB